jgi:hypothetical protein
MALPQAVQEQENRADALVKQLQLTKGEVVVVDEKKPTPPAAPEKEEVEKPQVAPEKAATPSEEEALEHKYKVLQGKYDKEMAQLRKELSQIRDQSGATIARQNELILDLHKEINLQTKEGVKDGEGETPAKDLGKPKVLKHEDFEGYGPEMKDLVDAANFALQQAEELRGKLAATKETEAERLAREADRDWKAFEDRLTLKNPEWVQKNNDPEFLSWLDGYDSARDPFTRKQKLQAFVDKRDPDKCLEFFKDYEASTGTPAAAKDETRPRKGDAVQPTPSAAGSDAPIPSNRDKGEISAAQVDQAGRDYAAKRISYAELEKITDAYQRGLAKKR